MQPHTVVSRDEWLAARKAHLAHEKKFTKARDELSRQRRELPWVRVEKPYVFEGPNGKETLADLFGARSQLIVYHFMLGPGWQQGCKSCSFLADHFDGAATHLAQRDVTLAVASRAPFAEIEAYQRRMGWRFKWVSSFGSDFNYDFNVSFTPDQIAKGEAFYNYEMGEVPLEDLSGLSVFYRDGDGDIFHTYSTFGRGGEETLGSYMYLDLTPKGRNETGPNHNLTDWVRHHDRYGVGGYVSPKGRWVASEDAACCCSERVAS